LREAPHLPFDSREPAFDGFFCFRGHPKDRFPKGLKNTGRGYSWIIPA
jgi:hypothetical protein